MIKQKVEALDLFAGIGGFHAALSSLDMASRVAGVVENDKFARTTYEAMFPNTPFAENPDIRAYTRSPDEYSLAGRLPERASRQKRIRSLLPDVDLVTAGLPCQPHSLMGNRQGVADDRGSLYFDALEIIRCLRPRNAVLENVRAFRSVNGGWLFNEVVSVLRDDLKYHVDAWTLDAQDYGVPQVRRRLFIVASRETLPSCPPPRVELSHREWLTTWHLLEREADIKYYLSERILKTVLKDQHKGYSRPADINRLTARPLTRTMHKMHRASQDNYFSDGFIRGSFDAECHTVRPAAEDGGIRRVTPREALRIQGFSELQINSALTAGISDTQLYMQAGNAVPPPLAAAVLGHLPW